MTSTSTGITTGTNRGGCGAAVTWLAAAAVLAWSSVCTAGVVNPSFETYYMGTPYPRPLPSGWWPTDHSSFNSKCNNLWSTDGALSVGLYNLVNKPISPGNGEELSQFVDLTGIAGIVFDVQLAPNPSGVFAHFAAEFLVDGVTLWSRTQGGVYLNQQVNVANLAGVHNIALRITALDSGPFDLAYWTQWDHIRLVEGPTTIPANVVLEPGTLNRGSNGKWITCYIELEAGGDPREIDGATVTLGDSVPAWMGDEGWAAPAANYENVCDFDDDGVEERMVKFDRAAAEALVQPPEATVTVKGRMFGGRPFEGAAVIRVIDGGKGPKGK
jgi:hypothetical protein